MQKNKIIRIIIGIVVLSSIALFFSAYSHVWAYRDCYESLIPPPHRICPVFGGGGSPNFPTPTCHFVSGSNVIRDDGSVHMSWTTSNAQAARMTLLGDTLTQPGNTTNLLPSGGYTIENASSFAPFTARLQVTGIGTNGACSVTVNKPDDPPPAPYNITIFKSYSGSDGQAHTWQYDIQRYNIGGTWGAGGTTPAQITIPAGQSSGSVTVALPEKDAATDCADSGGVNCIYQVVEKDVPVEWNVDRFISPAINLNNTSTSGSAYFTNSLSYPLSVTKEGQGTVTGKSGDRFWTRGSGGGDSENISSETGLLEPGNMLTPGQSINSANGLFRLAYQTDGNLVFYRNNPWGSIWDIYHDEHAPAPSAGYVKMQTDGNFVAYDASGRAYWDSESWGYHGAWLVVQNDGYIALRTSGPEVDCGPTCSQSIPGGYEVYLWANPDPGSTFIGWSGDCNWSLGSVCAIRMDAAKNVRAIFNSPPPYCTLSAFPPNVQQNESVELKLSVFNGMLSGSTRLDQEVNGVTTSINNPVFPMTLVPAQTTTFTFTSASPSITCYTNVQVTPHQSGGENPVPPN